MKKSIFYIAALALATGFYLPAMAQTDTILYPNRTRTFQDPKLPNDNQILIDTTQNIDSLLKQKRGKDDYKYHSGPMGEPVRPVKKAPADSSRRVRP